MSGMMVLSLLLAFGLGCLPFSQMIAQRRGVDLRSVGSGNIGATNLARALGYGAGAAGLLFDTAKGAAAVALARVLCGHGAGPAIAAVLAVAGHVFSPFLGFRGGKGVATGAGAFAALAPRAALVALGVFAVVVAIGRVVGLASVLAALALPLACYFLQARRGVTVAAALVATLVIVRHRENLIRLARGSESRLGERGTS